MVLRPKPPNLPTRVTTGPRSPEPPSRPTSALCFDARHLVLVDTVTPRVLAPVDVPSVSHNGLPPGDLVPRSKRHDHPSPVLGYSARHVHVRPSPPWSIGTTRH